MDVAQSKSFLVAPPSVGQVCSLSLKVTYFADSLNARRSRIECTGSLFMTCVSMEQCTLVNHLWENLPCVSSTPIALHGMQCMSCNRRKMFLQVPDAILWATDLIYISRGECGKILIETYHVANFRNSIVVLMVMRIVNNRSRWLLCRLLSFWDSFHLFVYGFTRSGWNIPGKRKSNCESLILGCKN